MNTEHEYEQAQATLAALGVRDASVVVRTGSGLDEVDWRVAVRMPSQRWYDLILRADGMWVVVDGASADWRAIAGVEFPTLHQAVVHYLLTVTE